MRRTALALGLALLAAGCQPDNQNIVLPTDIAQATLEEAPEPGTNPNAQGFSIDPVSASAALDGGTDFAFGGQTSADQTLGPVVSTLASVGGINPQVNIVGKVALSIDGLGITGSSGSIQVEKPSSGATVRAAYFMAASTGYSGATIANGDISLAGTPISWDIHQASYINSHNYWADVTSLMKPNLDPLAAGIHNFTVTEANSGRIDGTVLAVIWDDPAQTTDNTVSLLFGAQKTAGDLFLLGLDNPVDKTDSSLQIDMSLGISFGYQGSGQYSIVDVNGTRLTTSAGGRDDGNGGNGSLITVGGIGDSRNNPSPYAGPTTHRSDDELYNLVPLLNTGDQVIQVDTRNPSNDDNIFFAAFFLTVPALVGTEAPSADAGPDQTVEASGPAPFVEITVDGSNSYDVDGEIVSYDWFINGAPFPSLGSTLTHIFEVGVHTVRLVVTDNDGLTDEDEAIITVNPPANLPPVPGIILNCPEPYFEGGDACLNGGPTFDPNDDVGTLTFLWDYDDGTTYQQQGVDGQPNHVYKDNGTYNVRLVVTDPQGAVGETSRPTEVLNVTPTVDAGSGGTVAAGTAFNLDATFTDPGVLDAPWTWTVDWGDNTGDNGAAGDLSEHITLSHEFTDIGTYTVTVCVTDKDQAEGCATAEVEVTDPTPPVITYELSGQTGANGWYTGPVSVTWTVDDPESAISESTCVPMTADQDGAGQTFSCSATSAGGTTDVTTEAFDIDQTPPELTVQLVGTMGSNDWFVSEVTVDFTATDGTSGIAQDCTDVTVSADGTGYQYSCTATDQAGLSATATSAEFKIDATAPTANPYVSGLGGNNGWYVGPVTVQWELDDNLSGVATTCEAEVFSNDGAGQAAACSVTDNAGNNTNEVSPSFNIDQTAPLVTYSSYGATYDVTDQVNITCSATDATSGVYPSDVLCNDIYGEAWSFGPGLHTFSGSATDKAGNEGYGETSFTVSASYDGLCSLVEQWVSNKGVANSLCVKLAAAERAEDRGNTRARDGSLGAFINELEAQSGKKIDADKADILIAFAQAMM